MSDRSVPMLLLCSLFALAQSDGPLPGERSDLDALRSELADAALTTLEAHVEAGELGEARLLLWGIWAQSQRDRYWGEKKFRPRTRKRNERLAAIAIRYGRARDGTYGSFPALAADDGLVALNTQVRAARIGLGSGDLGTAFRVINHIKTRRAGGLAIPNETLVAAQALIEAYRAQNTTANTVLRTEGDALVRANLRRDDCDLDQRTYDLFELARRLEEIDGRTLALDRRGMSVVARLTNLYRGLREDAAGAREALVAFAAVAPDPEWIESAFEGFIAKDERARPTYASFLASVRAGAFVAPLLERLELPGQLIDCYLAYADACLRKADDELRAGRFDASGGQLTEAENAVATAEVLEAAGDELEARTARIAALRGAIGDSQLERARACLDGARAALEVVLEDRWALGRAGELLDSCERWLAKASEDGADVAELLASVTRVRTDHTAARVRIAEAADERAQAELAHAAELLAEGAEAWRVPRVVDAAERALTDADAQIAALGDDGLELRQQVAETRALGEKLRGEVAASQTLPPDVYAGDGASWKRSFRALIDRERDWEVLALSICDEEWKDKTAEYEYAGGGNTVIVETRWYRHLFVWCAIANPEDASRVDLRLLGFRLHKMTDGSYDKLKLFYVDEPLPMLRSNLP